MINYALYRFPASKCWVEDRQDYNSFGGLQTNVTGLGTSDVCYFAKRFLANTEVFAKSKTNHDTFEFKVVSKEDFY